MKTENLAAVPARLVASRPAVVAAETFAATQGRKGKAAWLGMFNNSRVVARDGDFFLVRANAFAAAGFNAAGFAVWQTLEDAELWIVDTRRIGVRVA
jgi:hypothetical protein